jgi:hypothetical protein
MIPFCNPHHPTPNLNIQVLLTTFVADIRHHVLDSRSSRFHTCFHFEFNNVKLLETDNIGNAILKALGRRGSSEADGSIIPASEVVAPSFEAEDDLAAIYSLVDEGCTLRMVDDPFTERELRVHLTRFREQLTDFKAIGTASTSAGGATAAATGIDVGASYLATVSEGFGRF